jgi:hypothetical protein
MNRNRLWRTAALAALAAALLTAAAGTAEARNKRLTAPYTYTMGDDIAERMAVIFRVTAGLEPAAIVTYDRKSYTLVAEILGSTEEVDGAKREVEGFLQAFRDAVVPYARKQHGIVLSDPDVTFIYSTDTGDEAPYEIVRRENGIWVEPVPESGD